MIVIKHRVNTISELRSTPAGLGVECDIRYSGSRLILHHDPFADGEGFEEFLKNYSHRFLIANIKSEGIENAAVGLLEKYGVTDYFLLDVSFPFIVKLANAGFKKLAIRFSEYESIETCRAMAGRAEWAFVDTFTRMPLGEDEHKLLAKSFRICLVSPELLGRQADIQGYRKIVKKMKLDAVLTKVPERWKD